MDSCETGSFEEHPDLVTPVAVVTDRDESPFGVELLVAGRNLPHGHELSPFDARPFVFPRLAYVEQKRLLPASIREPGGQLRRADLFHPLEPEARRLLGVR